MTGRVVTELSRQCELRHSGHVEQSDTPSRPRRVRDVSARSATAAAVSRVSRPSPRAVSGTPRVQRGTRRPTDITRHHRWIADETRLPPPLQNSPADAWLLAIGHRSHSCDDQLTSGHDGHSGHSGHTASVPADTRVTESCAPDRRCHDTGLAPPRPARPGPARPGSARPECTVLVIWPRAVPCRGA